MTMLKYILITLIASSLFVGTAFADRSDENLTEINTRFSRYGTATHYSGETGSYYYWQPETLWYTDADTGYEIWRMTFIPSGEDISNKEYATRYFSGDGSRIGFFDYSSARTSSDPSGDGGTYERWVVNSDGSGLRVGTGEGRDINDEAFLWRNTERATYFFSPTSTGDFSGAETDVLYEVTLDSNNGMSRESFFDFNDGQRKYIGWGKDSLSSTDAVLWTRSVSVTIDWDPAPPNDILSGGVYFVDLATPSLTISYSTARGFGPDADPYDNHVQANEDNLKGGSSYLVGPDGDAWLYQDGSEGVLFWCSTEGEATDGGPDWEDWDGDSFGTYEDIKAIWDNPEDANTPQNPYSNGYAGHTAMDRWGHYANVGDSHDVGHDVVWGDGTGHPGRIIADMTNNGGIPDWQDEDNSGYIGYDSYNYGGHASWTAWSDYTVFLKSSYPSGYDLILQGNYYNKSAKSGDTNYRDEDDIAYMYDVYTPTGNSSRNYNAYPRPSQSPDGTKVAFSDILFLADFDYDDDDDEAMGLSYVVAYYPHPPEITSCAATGGTVTATFEWMLDSTPRGYTTRGWPDESTDDPPPPRETEFFRLWRSADKSTWTPLGTTSAGIFERYDFADGTWDGNDYWAITDEPGDGTWYYAVTSVEWSGLESHALSNIYSVTVSSGSGTGAQDTAYPTYPGNLDDLSSDFKTAFAEADASTIRAYNIYAADDDTEAIQQQDIIATIPVSYCSGGSCHWVDWLGATDESTQYIIAAVDTQGNISDSTFVTSQAYVSCESGDCSAVSPEPTAGGQYLVTWADMYSAYSGGGGGGGGGLHGIIFDSGGSGISYEPGAVGMVSE